MSKLRVSCFSVSVDGYGAGPNQDEQNPLGRNGVELHGWIFPTRTFQRMHGPSDQGTTGVDDDFARRGFENVGAWILGRNMFGPVRGPWPDETLARLVGREPALPRAGLRAHASRAARRWRWMAARRSTSSPAGSKRRCAARARRRPARTCAWAAARPPSASTCARGLVDEMHLAVSPVLLGSGESLLEGLDLRALGYQVAEHVPGAAATHIVIRR